MTMNRLCKKRVVKRKHSSPKILNQSNSEPLPPKTMKTQPVKKVVSADGQELKAMPPLSPPPLPPASPPPSRTGSMRQLLIDWWQQMRTHVAAAGSGRGDAERSGEREQADKPADDGQEKGGLDDLTTHTVIAVPVPRAPPRRKHKAGQMKPIVGVHLASEPSAIYISSDEECECMYEESSPVLEDPEAFNERTSLFLRKWRAVKCEPQEESRRYRGWF